MSLQILYIANASVADISQQNHQYFCTILCDSWYLNTKIRFYEFFYKILLYSYRIVRKHCVPVNTVEYCGKIDRTEISAFNLRCEVMVFRFDWKNYKRISINLSFNVHGSEDMSLIILFVSENFLYVILHTFQTYTYLPIPLYLQVNYVINTSISIIMWISIMNNSIQLTKFII